MTEYAKPFPRMNPDNRPFWDGCRAHELRFQKCFHCGLVRWPPATHCPACHETASEWIVSAGKGRVYTYAVYHVAFQPGFKEDLPYVVAIVELAEGPRLFTNIIGCSPSDVSCDMPVEVVWEDVDEALTLGKFRPVS